MRNELSSALLEFYQQILQPELEAIKKSLTSHDEGLLQMLGHFDVLFKRLDRLEDEYQAIAHGLARIETSLQAGAGQRDDLARRLAVMKEQFGTLQTRLEEIEKEVVGA
jgi:predicted nuclease with TOPRIM domain